MIFYTAIINVLLALGFGFVTYAGFDSLISSLVSVVSNTWDGMGGNILSILDMAGFTNALGYLLSAVTTKAAMTATKRFMPK